MTTTQTELQELNAATLPLTGKHVIEASAGTGKTYNITRLYLRLLLEKKLTVQQILVVTFTHAATQELKGRIAKALSEAITQWHIADKGSADEKAQQDAFFVSLCQNIHYADAKIRLDNALLHLDEAAIFTIHGFCSRVLAEHNLLAGLSFDMALATDTRSLIIEAIQDEYRRLSQTPASFALLAAHCPTPDAFYHKYVAVIKSTTALKSNSVAEVEAQLQQAQRIASAQLLQDKDFIWSVLVSPHKQASVRADEWQQILTFLQMPLADILTLAAPPKVIAGFFHGNRYKSQDAEIKNQIKATYQPIKAFIEAVKSFASDSQKAQRNTLLCELINKIRQLVDSSKQQQNLLDFNDLIEVLSRRISQDAAQQSILASELNTETKAENQLPIAQAIAKQYPAILVDEFQDTDANQYQIFENIHQQADEQLFLMIGDPKQAIYKFRGGDIHTYLSARDKAHYQWMMDTNYRSGGEMIQSYNRLFFGQALNQNETDYRARSTQVFANNISYQPVRSQHQDQLYLQDDNSPYAAMSLAWFALDDNHMSSGVHKTSYQSEIAAWLADEVLRLLTSHDSINLVDETKKIPTKRAVQQNDIAILVRDKGEAQVVEQALKQKGINSVYLSNRENIYKTPQAQYIYRFMQGILNIEDGYKLVAALATPLIGLNEAALKELQQNEVQWEYWRDKMAQLRQQWQQRGFISMAFKALQDYCQPEADNTERQLTNYFHLIELIQAKSQEKSNPQQLLDWLYQQINDPELGTDAELRLESEAELVRIVTLHGSKGLEYPIVFVPFVTRSKEARHTQYYTYFDQASQSNKTYFGDDKTILQQYEQENQAEDVRLLYVAITRAVYRCYLACTPFKNSHLSPLGLALKINGNDELEPSLISLANELTSIAFVAPLTLSLYQHMGRLNNEPLLTTLAAKCFKGRIESHWRMHSFSALTHAAHYKFEPASVIDHKEIDEPLTAEQQAVVNRREAEAQQLCFRFPKGAKAGLALHEVFEFLDFTEPDFSEAWQTLAQFLQCTFVQSEVDDYVQQRSQLMAKPTELQTDLLLAGSSTSFSAQDCLIWLDRCLQTPLNAQGLTLNQLSSLQTLREVTFYFPLANNTSDQINRILQRYRQTEKTVDLKLQVLSGMMNGIIDLVFEWQGRYYVADYKSNHLGHRFDCYDDANMQSSMESSFYDLQALLYNLALHKYLKQRLTDYQPEAHLGGSYYLYLRGMQGEVNENGSAASDFKTYGVYYRAADISAIEQLDACLTQTGEDLTQGAEHA